MPKTIQLNVFARVRLADIIGSQEASGVQAQRELMRLLEVIEIPPAEQSRLGMSIDPRQGFVSWDPTIADQTSPYPIRLSDNQATLLAAILSNEGGRYRVALKPRGDEWAPVLLDVLRGESTAEVV